MGYIVWRFTQALRDTEGKGTGFKGLCIRFWYMASGLFYSGLALYAGRLALQGQVAKGSDASEKFAAKVLTWPAGDWLIILSGLVIIGVGIYQAYRAYARKLESDVNGRRLSPGQERLVYHVAQVGVTARGVVVSLIGYFLLRAGQLARAEAVGSTDEAFNLLATMGPVALGGVAAGLMAYGVYSLVQARYPILRGL